MALSARLQTLGKANNLNEGEVTFGMLKRGDTFDWINPHTNFNSYFERCVKTGVRTYESLSGSKMRVGSVHAFVWHVEEA